MAVLVTGATGMTGAHILEKLIREGHTPIAIKRNKSSIDYPRRLFRFYNNPYFSKIVWREADVTDPVSLIEAMEGVEKVIHAAGLVSFDPKDSKKIYEVNLTGTQNMVNACLVNRIKKLVHISSVAALGKVKAGDLITEETIWKDDSIQSPYAIAKYKGECEVWRGIEEGLNAAILNPAIILGPCLKDKSSGMLISAYEKGGTFYSGGSFGFVDVRDVAMVAIAMLEEAFSNDRYIVSSENLEYRELINMFCDAFGKKRPHIKANQFMLRVAVFLEWLKSKLSDTPPRLTKYTCASSLENNNYSNEKISRKMNINFYSIKETIANAVKFRFDIVN